MSKVSLIIPVYNTEQYLRRCLDSAINQTLKDIEIIVINDGSTDNSLTIIQEYASKDKRIKVIDQNNQGLSASRNNGVQKAQGDYVAFMDSDDDASLTMLEDLYTKVQTTQSDIIVSTVNRIMKKGISLIYFDAQDDNHFIHALSPNFPVTVCGRLYKKTLFTDNAISFPVGRYYEDQSTTLKLFYYAKRVTYIKEAYYNYYDNEETITSSISEKKIEDIFHALLQIKEFLEKKELFKRHEQDLFYRFVKILDKYVLVHLNEKKDDEIRYLLHHLKKFELYNVSNINALKKNYIGLYFNLMIFLVKFLDKDRKEQLVQEGDKATFDKLHAEYNKKREISFESLLLTHLDVNDIDDVVIYGAGATYVSLKPKLKNNGITVKAIIDKNAANLTHLTEKVIHLDEYLNGYRNSPIVITSIAFATEISNEIRNSLTGYEIDIIDINLLLRGD